MLVSNSVKSSTKPYWNYFSLNGKDNKGNNANTPMCVVCQPHKKFESSDAARIHMNKVHWTKDFLADLPYEKKVASAQALKKYLETGYLSQLQPGYKTCDCIEEMKGETSAFKVHLHEMIAGHRPYHKCLRCGIVVHPALLGVHLLFNCDDEKAAAMLHKNKGKMPGLFTIDKV